MRVRHKKIKQTDNYAKDVGLLLLAIAALVAITALLVVFKPQLSGAFTAIGAEWENQIDISATSQEQQIVQHILFGEYKPASCAEGIYVEATSNSPLATSITFTTQNEIYSDGFCSEADVVFDNIIYSAQPNSEPPASGFSIMTGMATAETITYTIYYGEMPEQEAAVPEEQMPAEEPAPLFGTQEFTVQGDISGCTNITEPGVYTLTGSISNSAVTVCINITASNVTFDGQGFTIDGDGIGVDYGIYAYKPSTTLTNVTVKNVTVTDWTYGIYYQSAQNGSIENATASGSAYYGIYLYSSSDNNTLTNNKVNTNNDGIRLTTSSYNKLINNNASNNLACGIYIYVSGNNILTNNSANSNSETGIQTALSDNNIITNNNATGNGFYGIYLVSSNYGNLTSNIASSNTLTGINLQSSNNNTLTSNTANSNNQQGIYILSDSESNTLTNNRASSNGGSGIVLDTTRYNNFISNTVTNNNYGVYFISASNNTLTSNNASSNSYGIYIYNDANNNILFNNIINNNAQHGVYLRASSNNNITDGSLASNSISDYRLESAGTTNNFTATNFTAERKISFTDTTSWFNYNNATINNIWLKTNVSAADTITRELISWNQSLVQWNDTGTTTANYIIAGLVSSIAYDLYNNSIKFGTKTTDAAGALPQFSINLASEHEIKAVLTATLVTNCTNITSSGIYILQNNITWNGISTCINISVSNVTFDGQGFTIDSNDTDNTYGIYAYNPSATLTNITVKNVTVTDWFRGIYFGTVQNSSITNSTAISNDVYTGVAGGVGIYLSSSSYNSLINNTANSNKYGGIYVLSSSNYNNLTSNTANNNSPSGIYISASSNNNLTSNNASSNQYGIRLVSASNNNIFTGNTLSNNSEYGVILESSSNYNNLTNNTMNGNTKFGLFFSSANYNNIINNAMSNNSQQGLYLSSSNNNTITSNTANSNSQYGIYLYSSSNNNLTSNNASSNNLWDIYSTGSTNNIFANQTIGSTYATTTSFIYSGNIDLKGVSSPPADPTNYSNISKYINATNQSANAWLYINISYSDSDVVSILESTLKLWRNSSGEWNSSLGTTTNTVDTANNYVYANITSFGSVFAPLGIAQVSEEEIISEASGVRSGVLIHNYTFKLEPGASETYELMRLDEINILFNATTHNVKLESIIKDSYEFIIRSAPITFQLKIGESKEIDLDKDGVEDLQIKLINTLPNGAAVKLSTLTQVAAPAHTESQVLPVAPKQTSRGVAPTAAFYHPSNTKAFATPHALLALVVLLSGLAALGYYRHYRRREQTVPTPEAEALPVARVSKIAGALPQISPETARLQARIARLSRQIGAAGGGEPEMPALVFKAELPEKPKAVRVLPCKPKAKPVKVSLAMGAVEKALARVPKSQLEIVPQKNMINVSDYSVPAIIEAEVPEKKPKTKTLPCKPIADAKEIFRAIKKVNAVLFEDEKPKGKQKR